MRNFLRLGDWNARCDSCGRKFKASSLKQRWDGLIVCQEDWETRHPQDFLRVQRERIAVPFVRSENAPDTYIGYICSVSGVYGMADVGSADCAKADLYNPAALSLARDERPF
jgi:hypothetical protein